MRKPKLAHRIFEKWQNSKASRVFTVCCSLSLFLHDKFLLPSSALTIRAGRSDGNNEEPAVVYSEDVSYPKERSLSGGASSTEADNPAPYDGQYCRGGACQYRTPPPPKPKPKPDEPPTVAIPPAFDAPDKREFCTGLGCLGGMGFPVAASAATFNENCVELTDVIAGGFEVDPHSKTVRLRQALANFNKWCTARVTADEAGACAVAFTDDAKTKNGEYADVMTMALSNVAKASAVGDVCSALGGFLGAAKAAQDKLQLTMESLKSAGNAMLDIGKKMKYSDDSTATSAQSGNQASAVPTSKASAKSQIGLTWWQQKPGQYVGAPPCDTYDALKSPPKSYLIRAPGDLEPAVRVLQQAVWGNFRCYANYGRICGNEGQELVSLESRQPKGGESDIGRQW
ncbi:unnamed protein product [Amoebophrya sp. A120]|nr:unnamed protein product [Amoebophrya sp. A120]|eukprot:GSA120T00019733001.1